MQLCNYFFLWNRQIKFTKISDIENFPPNNNFLQFVAVVVFYVNSPHMWLYFVNVLISSYATRGHPFCKVVPNSRFYLFRCKQVLV